MEKTVASGSATKIVVLDGYALNPGDLSWDALKELGSSEIYDRTPEELVVERAGDADAVLASKTLLSGATLRTLSKLRYIGVLGTGYNNVDIKAAKELGIAVANVPTYGTASVAQFTFALLLELCCHVGLHRDVVRAGAWSQSPDWSFWRAPLLELAGKTLGIVGLGRIGREVARIAIAMQMRVISTTRTRPKHSGNSDLEMVELEDLLAASDVVSLHCPLTPENKGFIDSRRLSMMKPSAFLVNTSRGPLIVDQDLADALNAGRLAGAALDVLSIEPPPAGNPLFQARNCIITPHIAWATLEARSRLIRAAIDNLAAFLSGRPQNIVS